jgi:hypothetical protein
VNRPPNARIIRGITQLSLLLAAPIALHAQQSIGSVGVQDATVTGALEVSNGRAVLVGSSTVKALTHATDVTLTRGGEVRVCATSGLHLTEGKSPSGPSPLMIALDRGALEVRLAAMQSDIIMTPDLRFAMQSPGPLDLRIRVAPNGDTCVENRGDKAPILNIADQFGQSTYQLKPDQHVLFEHGSLKEVVDHEPSPCGCPPEPAVSVADSGVASSNPAAPGAAVSPNGAGDQHPFPAAVSEGLAPPSGVPQAPPGVVHAQVSTTMAYDANEPAPPKTAAASASNTGAPATSSTTPASSATTPAPATTGTPAPQPTTTAQAPPPPPAPGPGNVFRSIGHFFKHLFGGG